MAPLSNQQVQTLGLAVGLHISEPELTEVAHGLNAILESMAEIDLRDRPAWGRLGGTAASADTGRGGVT